MIRCLNFNRNLNHVSNSTPGQEKKIEFRSNLVSHRTNYDFINEHRNSNECIICTASKYKFIGQKTEKKYINFNLIIQTCVGKYAYLNKQKKFLFSFQQTLTE